RPAIGSAAITVGFSHRAGEIDDWIGGTSVDYDDAGELLVSGAPGVTVLSPSLAVKWNVPLAGPARFDPAGDVFVLATDGVHKLDPTGAPLWTRASATATKDIAPTPSGGVVLLHDAGLEIWDASSATIASPAIDVTPALCVGA